MTKGKTCPKCGKEKLHGDFYKRSGMKCLRSWCKECEKIENKKLKPVVNVDSKHCPECKRTMSSVMFGEHCRSRDGLRSRCKECTKRKEKLLVVSSDRLIERKCSSCKVVKSSDHFYWNRAQRGGLNNICRSCVKLNYDSNSYEPVSEKFCHGCSRILPMSHYVISRKRTTGLSARCRSCSRSNKFGINAIDLEAAYLSQGGRCAICLEEMVIDDLVIDHCHSSGNMRGMLCGTCNSGIGMFRDNIKTLLRAIDYIQRSVDGFAEKVPA